MGDSDKTNQRSEYRGDCDQINQRSEYRCDSDKTNKRSAESPLCSSLICFIRITPVFTPLICFIRITPVFSSDLFYQNHPCIHSSVILIKQIREEHRAVSDKIYQRSYWNTWVILIKQIRGENHPCVLH
jgi:hypothetical protein